MFISPPNNEAELIARVQSGDKDEFRLLISMHQDTIIALISKQVGDASLAEDLAQEVFMKAYFNIKKFKGNSKFSTWLTRIALNQTNSYFASKKYKTDKLNDSFDHSIHTEQKESFENELEISQNQDHQIKLFQIALSKLKPKFRDVLSLCALEEKSYEEAAQILEIPVGTVRSRLNKARLLLISTIKQVEAV